MVPLSGYAGFKLIEKTYDRQLEVFSSSLLIQRNSRYFVDNAGSIATAEQFVQDRQLLEVGLGAFGLDDEINKRALILRVLDEGIFDASSFANRLNDTRYRDFAEQIGFGPVGSLLTTASQREEIAERYQIRQFERAVGDVDVDLRLVLNFRREIQELALNGLTPNAGWFRVLGSEPLRTVLQGALNLPTEFAQLAVDDQRIRIAEKSREVFGGDTIDVFLDAEVVDKAIQRYLLTEQINDFVPSANGARNALSLLQTASIGPAASASLFSSEI